MLSALGDDSERQTNIPAVFRPNPQHMAFLLCKDSQSGEVLNRVLS